MTDFGLTDLGDPEDAFDASDPAHVRVLNLVRRLLWVIDHFDLDPAAVRARIERVVDDLTTLREELAD